MAAPDETAKHLLTRISVTLRANGVDSVDTFV